MLVKEVDRPRPAAPAAMQEPMRGARILLEAVVREGTDTIFGYPGGAVLHIYDELAKMGPRLRHVLARHEQGAVHMAEGYSKATGKPGVVLVTSGPGATNTVTGIANAYMDSTPLVIITGQVPRKMIGTDAFQEVDTIGITRPCTKYNYMVRDVDEIASVVHEAFYLACSGRPGQQGRLRSVRLGANIVLAQERARVPGHSGLGGQDEQKRCGGGSGESGRRRPCRFRFIHRH